MAKLSDMYKLIGNYLELHGDKEITSIATWNGVTPNQYTLNLHNVYEGNIGTNPFTGEDHLDIPR